MATMQGFLDALGTARATNAGVAAAQVDDPTTDPNAPDLDEIRSASIERTESAGDGPDVTPVYEGARPLVDDTISDPNLSAGKSRPYGVPIPIGSAAFTGVPAPGGTGLPVQVVPASGGRPRHVVIRNTSADAEPVKLYTELSGSGSTSTPPPGGYTLPAGETLLTTTQGAVWVAAADVWEVSIWIDTYPEP